MLAQSEARFLQRETLFALREEESVSQQLAKREENVAKKEASMVQREQAILSREASSGRREQALQFEISELRRQLASEKATAATAVEMHQVTKAAVQVKKEKVENLEQEHAEIRKCNICYERDVEVILLKCMHACLCSACAEQLQNVSDEKKSVTCPLCREKSSNNGRGASRWQIKRFFWAT